MKIINKTNVIGWTPQVWPGNPSLNLVASCKIFINPLNRKKTPVWVFGGTKEYQGFSFCVSAGRNSDYSYTGKCVDCNELHNATLYVDNLAYNNKLFK